MTSMSAEKRTLSDSFGCLEKNVAKKYFLKVTNVMTYHHLNSAQKTEKGHEDTNFAPILQNQCEFVPGYIFYYALIQ